LKEHSGIVLVIVDTPNESNDVVIKYISDVRQQLAWSRLPAIMLLPNDRGDLPELLIKDGATSPHFFKPYDDKELLMKINSSLSYNVDLQNLEI
jgi:hypothetical protein